MVKVIASSLRKGNVVDKDGRLYVILFAENIHPGKGTPVTQLDMRRIGDGVKVSERYRTTEMVERAYVEDRDFTYLYQDGVYTLYTIYATIHPDSIGKGVTSGCTGLLSQDMIDLYNKTPVGTKVVMLPS